MKIDRLTPAVQTRRTTPRPALLSPALLSCRRLPALGDCRQHAPPGAVRELRVDALRVSRP